MATSSCSLCRGPAEARLRGASGDLSICRKCCKDRVVPFLIEALGPAEIASTINGMGAGAGKIGIGSAAMMSLVDAAQKARRRAKRERRPMSAAELSLSLSATAAVQEAKTAAANNGRSAGRVTKEGIAAAVQRAGLRTNSKGTTSLSTGTGSTPRPATRRPQPAGQVTKEGIAEAVRKAGLRTA